MELESEQGLQIENWKLVKPIGSGTFGDVYLA
jgi:hypothetical protein